MSNVTFFDVALTQEVKKVDGELSALKNMCDMVSGRSDCKS
jgi:hypothetical protein